MDWDPRAGLVGAVRLGHVVLALMVSILSLGPNAQRQIAEQFRAQAKPARKTKYNNSSQVVDGYRFDSKRELMQYLALKMQQERGEISELRVHPAWRLMVNNVLIADYVADFSHLDSEKFLRVIDVKSKATRTPAYQIKRRLMQALHYITVIEVA